MSKKETKPDSRYHDVRFTYDPRRDRVWKEIVRYLKAVFEFGDDVLDVGCGYGEFINNVSALRRSAVDLSPTVKQFLDPEVSFHAADALQLDQLLPGESFSLIFSSNLVEHLNRDDIGRLFRVFHRLVRPGGYVAVVMPNYRLVPHRYFDDYTHRTPVSDIGLTDWLAATGLRPVFVDPAFLPFSMKSYRFEVPRLLIRAWFRSPLRPRAGQMIVVARRPDVPGRSDVEK